MIHASHVNPLRQLPLKAAPETNAARRPRSVEDGYSPALQPAAIGNNAQASADSQLAGLFAQTLRSGASTGRFEDIDNIPPASAFGRWWSHLHQLMQSPHFATWAASQGIDRSKSIEINTRGRYLSAMVGGTRTSFSGFEHGYLWASMMTPIMHAANALTSRSGYVFSPTSSTSAPCRAVADFYGEAINGQSRETVAARAAELEKTKTFGAPQPATERSEEALQREQADLADVYDQRQVALKLIDSVVSISELSETLMHRTTLQHTDASYLPPEQANTRLARVIRNALGKADIALHADSPSRALKERATVSVETYLGDNGWDVPKSRDELINLGRVLTTPRLARPAHANFGGALSWPQPLSDENRREIRVALRQNTLGVDDLRSYDEGKGVLGYLTRNQQFAPSELHDPARFIQHLLTTPKAQALGLALQRKFNGVSTPESINDWTLAALGATLDSKSEAGNTSAPARTGVAGFDMARYEHWGRHPGTVVAALAKHLIDNEHVRADMAPVAVHVLLSRRAPAFLIKGIPDKVAYGTHSWVSFSTAVARFESQAPGSTAQMTYAEVMQRADLAPVTEYERRVEQLAQREALKDWGVASGVIPLNTLDNDTDEQMRRVFEAFNVQVAVLSEASRAHSTPMPERKQMALEALKRAYGDNVLFEEKCIKLVPGQRDYPGPYSVLDLYLTNSFRITAGFYWSSSNRDIDISHIVRNCGTLPDVNKRFSTELPAYFASMEKAIGTQVRNLIATLPLEDRKNLEYGKITTNEEYSVTQSAFSQAITETKVPNRLLVKTERDDVITVYELDLKENTIRPRDELKTLPSGPQTYSDGHSRYTTMLKEIEPSGSYSSGITAKKPAAGTPNSFASEKTGYIADAMLKTVGIYDMAAQARGVTTFDTEVPFYKKAREFILNLTPVRSAIQNFQAGNVGEGIVDLVFDAFGFAVGLGAAAKGAQALQAGVSAASKFARGVHIVGRAALGSLNPLGGVDDIARGLINGGRKLFGLPGKALSRLDPASLSKISGVAEGTLKQANAADELKLFAQFDDATGGWYALNLQTKQPYGLPLENFKPDAVQVHTLRNNLQALHEKLGGESGFICYQKALYVGRADNALPFKTRQTVLDSLNMSASNTSNYTARYEDLMGVSASTRQSTFNPADIKESGIINFVSRNEGGRIVHTAYIQRTRDNTLFLYSTNQAELDLAMYTATGTIETSAGAMVSNLDNGGLQSFLDKGYDAVFTPNSVLNANAGRMAA